MIDDTPASRAEALPLVGGTLALDFCNTSSGRGTTGHIEHLRTVDDLFAWAFHAGIVDADQRAALSGYWAARRGEARRMLGRSLAFRDAVHAIVAALAAGQEPEPGAIEAVGREHAACLAKGRLTTRDGSFGWSWAVDEAPAEVVLGPIAASAMALVTAADHARLKRCPGHHCGWLFLDTTKSSNRRWCEMEVCGNRAKQKRRRNPPAPAF